MLSVAVRALSSVSVTVMVCLPFFRRIAALASLGGKRGRGHQAGELMSASHD
jgi:hypothetical protein